jgi:hypothetical protein
MSRHIKITVKGFFSVEEAVDKVIRRALNIRKEQVKDLIHEMADMGTIVRVRRALGLE